MTHLHEEFKIVKLIEAKRMVITIGNGRENRKVKVKVYEVFRYARSVSPRDLLHTTVPTVNNIVLYA